MKKAKKTTKKKSPRKKAAPKLPEDSGFEKPVMEEILVYGDYQNPLWKKGKTKAGRGDGCKVFVPKRFSGKIRGKVVECELVDENGETYYKYQP